MTHHILMTAPRVAVADGTAGERLPRTVSVWSLSPLTDPETRKVRASANAPLPPATTLSRCWHAQVSYRYELRVGNRTIHTINTRSVHILSSLHLALIDATWWQVLGGPTCPHGDDQHAARPRRACQVRGSPKAAAPCALKPRAWLQRGLRPGVQTPALLPAETSVQQHGQR